MPKIINWQLLSHPMNWLIVWMMLIIGALLLDVCRQYHQQQ